MRRARRYFPDGMPPRRYYEPVPRGLEIKIAEALARLRAGGTKKECRGEMAQS